METLDSGIGSRSPTPDSSHSQTNSSKVTKVATQTNHINNNSHINTNSNGTVSSKTKGSEKGDASSATPANSVGGVSSSSNNHNSTSSNNHSNNTSTNNSKTYRDYNNRHSSLHGQYKKYGSHQNHHYGYGSQNAHYQRYNGSGHRTYGNKHFNSTTNYHHHNHHYQSYQHHQHFGQQNHHHTHNGSNNHSSSSSNGSHSSSQQHQHHSTNHHNGYHNNQHHQYFNPNSGTSVHHHHSRSAPPQVFISSDTVDSLSWPRRGGGETNNTNWSSPSPTVEAGDPSVQISLNLSALKQGFYSPSLQNASPATSPSTTDSSDAYSLQEENSSGNGSASGANNTRHNGSAAFNFPNGIPMEPIINGNGTIGPPPNGSAAGYAFAPFHPSGFYTYPGAAGGPHHMIGGGRSMSHHQLIGQNLGLLMPADSCFAMSKADSSISSSSSEKTLEWSDDGTYFTAGDREDFICTSPHLDRCLTPEYIYTPLNYTGPIATAKKRFYNGTGATPGKLSPAAQNQRFHNFPRKPTYNTHGLPREWFDDLDPEEYVKAFSKFGEVKERPPALAPNAQNPQSDSLSEGIWLKFVANQQTTETFRKKMELWRDVYRILRTLNHNAHFKHDPRNFPSFGLQVVGSTMSGFGSNTSDVDMCLLIRGSDVDQRYEAVDKLQVLFGALSATQWLDNVELIYAKVPILKFSDPKRSLEVDLNCNNFVGIRNTHLLYCYSQADWRLKPLVLVVKLWAHYHGINDAKNMTISSYSLVLMVINFLQCGVEDPVLPVLQQMYPDKFNNTNNILNVKINEILPPWQSTNTESIGNLLIQFLDYFANKFDYSENAISVRTGGTIPIKQAAVFKSVKNDPHQWKYLCIEEPFDRTNTARSVYDRDTFDKIVGIFNLSYQRLLVSRNLESIFTVITETDARAMAVLLR